MCACFIPVIKNKLVLLFFNLYFQGWVHNVRRQKRVVFCKLSDGTSDQLLQIVADPEICPRSVKMLKCNLK